MFHICHGTVRFCILMTWIFVCIFSSYFFNLIVPCVLIASMALLGKWAERYCGFFLFCSSWYFFTRYVHILTINLPGFTLPPDSGEKLSLGMLRITLIRSKNIQHLFCLHLCFHRCVKGVTILLSLTVFLNMVAGNIKISFYHTNICIKCQFSLDKLMKYFGNSFSFFMHPSLFGWK